MSPLTIALFPLHTVLYPDGVLPLRIFEVRYLDMIRRAIDTHSAFGVVPMLRGHEVRRPGEEIEFAEVGTLASVSAWTAPQPGLLEVVCDGTSRFRIVGSHVQPNGLWMADIELIAPDSPVTVPDELADCVRAFEAALPALREAADEGRIAPLRQPMQLGDCGWLANRWCELLPLPLEQKIRLLQLDNPLLRLELVQDTLEELGWLEGL